ncbi:MAG TPA: DUF2092 domain-containing protein [Candidatus Polarisedimenticolaceae bacterium]|nr:DUF2092 domain-containing protein [Candidatus Polarisedimenticolaceae bacterium]
MDKMKLLSSGLLLLLAGLPTFAQQGQGVDAAGRSPAAIEILQKVDAAVKAISAVRYDVKTVPGGVAEQMVGPGEASVVLIGWNGRIPEKFHVEGKTARGGQPVTVTGGGNGDSYFLVDHTTKKGYEDMDPAVLGGSAQALMGFAMLEFVHDRPFDDELAAEVAELRGSKTIGGVDCHEIRVVYSSGQGESIWYFSKTDYTPRGRVRVFNTPQGEGTITVTIENLEIDPKVDATLFVMNLPAGYEEIDDFAP